MYDFQSDADVVTASTDSRGESAFLLSWLYSTDSTISHSCMLICLCSTPNLPLVAPLRAALHSQMEHMKMAVRVCRAASKKPHSRTKQDISLIMSETSKIPLLTRNGPAVHRDLCHVMQAVQLQQMQSLKLPSDFKSAAFVHVSCHKLAPPNCLTVCMQLSCSRSPAYVCSWDIFGLR